MNEFKYEEYLELCRRLGSKDDISDVTIVYDSKKYFNRLKNMVLKDRRGEVVFCVIRPNGKIISVTCSEYPEGIYRIPTGGVGHNEDIMEAVFREVREELGLEAKIRSFGGVVRVRFEHSDEFFMFYSYIFILASDDEVSGVKETDLAGLEEIVNKLNHIKGKWQDWGRFRYVTSKAVLELLRNCG